MGWEEGGRFKMGNTCIPVADSFGFVWQNQYNIVKLKNKKNKRNTSVNDGKPVSDGTRCHDLHFLNVEL